MDMHETSTARPASETNGTMTELIAGIVNDATKLIGQHIDMFKAEVREDFGRSARAGLYAGMGVAFMTVAGLCLIFGLVRFMDWLFPEVAEWVWWAILVAGCGLGAAVCGLSSKHLVESFNPLPDKTFNALQENLSWIAKSRK